MEITFGYEVIETHPVTVNISEEELQKDGWNEMTKEERLVYLRDKHGFEIGNKMECEYSFKVVSLDYIQFDKEKNWMY